MHTRFWLGTAETKGLVGRQRCAWEKIKMNATPPPKKKQNAMLWSGSIWLNIGASGVHVVINVMLSITPGLFEYIQ